MNDNGEQNDLLDLWKDLSTNQHPKQNSTNVSPEEKLIARKKMELVLLNDARTAAEREIRNAWEKIKTHKTPESARRDMEHYLACVQTTRLEYATQEEILRKEITALGETLRMKQTANKQRRHATSAPSKNSFPVPIESLLNAKKKETKTQETMKQEREVERIQRAQERTARKRKNILIAFAEKRISREEFVKRMAQISTHQ